MEGMDELTITQLQRIMKWSYPTALKFAALNGEMREGKWYVPRDVLVNEVSQLEEEVTRKWAALENAEFIGS